MNHEVDGSEREEYEAHRQLQREQIESLEHRLGLARQQAYMLHVGPAIIKWLRATRPHGGDHTMRLYREGLARRIKQGEHLEIDP